MSDNKGFVGDTEIGFIYLFILRRWEIKLDPGMLAVVALPPGGRKLPVIGGKMPSAVPFHNAFHLNSK